MKYTQVALLAAHQLPVCLKTPPISVSQHMGPKSQHIYFRNRFSLS